MNTGLAGAELVRATPPTGTGSPEKDGPNEGTAPISGERLKVLIDLVSAIEQGLRAFGRRNRSIRDFINLAQTAADPKVDPRAGLLPQFLIEDRGKEVHCWTEQECDEYRHTEDVEFLTDSEFEAGERDGVQATATAGEPGPEPMPSAGKRKVRRIELHEVKTLNKHLARLRDEFSLRADVLLPREVTGDEPPPRFMFQRDGEAHMLLDLRSLVSTVRKIGEKGMKITRFKGLGEMDAEQLWETTMDPTRRTLLQVRLDDAAAANDIFATLMGDDVEPRREFIEKHALEVKNLDV
jgi:DNA gyrase subunit B